METEGSLPHLQEPAACPYPEPDQSSLRLPTPFLRVHLNIILTSVPGSSKLSLTLNFFHHNAV